MFRWSKVYKVADSCYLALQLVLVQSRTGSILNIPYSQCLPLLSKRVHTFRKRSRALSSCVQEENRRGQCSMPKKDKTNPQSKGTAKDLELLTGPVTRDKSGTVCIAIHAKPGSKQNAITDVSAQTVGISIAAPPSDGEANTELLRYLSKVLDVKKSSIVLDKGSRSREKIVKISGSISPEEVLDKLRREAAL